MIGADCTRVWLADGSQIYVIEDPLDIADLIEQVEVHGMIDEMLESVER